VARGGVPENTGNLLALGTRSGAFGPVPLGEVQNIVPGGVLRFRIAVSVGRLRWTTPKDRKTPGADQEAMNPRSFRGNSSPWPGAAAVDD